MVGPDPTNSGQWDKDGRVKPDHDGLAPQISCHSALVAHDPSMELRDRIAKLEASFDWMKVTMSLSVAIPAILTTEFRACAPT